MEGKVRNEGKGRKGREGKVKEDKGK